MWFEVEAGSYCHELGTINGSKGTHGVEVILKFRKKLCSFGDSARHSRETGGELGIQTLLSLGGVECS